MSWQEELQQLDTELAQGRVTPEDYRLRRDQLLNLAQQSTPPPGMPQQQEQPPPSGPFAAPFRWQPSTPGAGPVESTQVMRPVSDDQPPPDTAERTQVVRGAGTAAPGENAERTQVVRGGGAPQNFPPLSYQGFTPQQPGQQGQQQPPPWGQPQPAGANPWSDDDLSPPNPGDVSWMRQGPEVFNDSSSSKGKVFGAVAIVVLLLLVGFGVYWFGFRNSATTADQNPTTPAVTTTTPSLPPTVAPNRVPQMPGKLSDKAGTATVEDALAKGILFQAEVAPIKAAGASYVSYSGAANTPFDYAVLLINSKGINEAKKLADAFQAPGHDIGQPVADHAGLPQSVTVYKAVLADHTTYRAIYTAGAAVVRVDVNEAPANDTAVTKEFQAVMKAMLENVPVS